MATRAFHEPRLESFLAPQASRTFRVVVNDGAEPCKRCGGRGAIPQFAHIEGGICFWCNGSGKQ